MWIEIGISVITLSIFMWLSEKQLKKKYDKAFSLQQVVNDRQFEELCTAKLDLKNAEMDIHILLNNPSVTEFCRVADRHSKRVVKQINKN